MPLIFCNIAWMKNYKGQYDRNGKIIDQPERGGEYVKSNGEAHESCNFLEDQNGLVHGHVETWRGDNDTDIKIENLGASKKDSYISGVDVIWIATHEEGGKRVVGWYKDAIIYRSRQNHGDKFPTEQHERDNIGSYRIVAKKENTHLIKENERNLILDPNRNRVGWPGRSSIFYPSNYEENEELNLFIENIKQEMDSETLELPETKEDISYEEGGAKLSQHKRKERSRKLIKAFKSQLTDFSCVICGFSFEESYGSLGKEYIEAHHTIPISSLTEKTKMNVSDLAGVCSNCHRMLHKQKYPLSIKELRNIVKNQR